MTEPNVVDDIFLYICDMLDFQDVLKMQCLDEYHKYIIQKHIFKNVQVTFDYSNDIPDILEYITRTFNFTKYHFGSHMNLTNNNINLIKNPSNLSINNSGINGITEICKHTSLKYLHIYSSNIGPGLGELENLTNLISLNLHSININYESIKKISKLSKLLSLNLTKTYIQYDSLEEIYKMTNFDTLNI